MGAGSKVDEAAWPIVFKRFSAIPRIESWIPTWEGSFLRIESRIPTWEGSFFGKVRSS
jgi:hypothetical protein